MAQERTNGESSAGPGVWQALRALMDALASTRLAVVLLAAIAVATLVATVLPDDVAGRYVYGRSWFSILLGLLGVNLVACMVWRRRIGMVRLWSLLTHTGIVLVLAGAMVTLVWAERGWIKIYEGERHELAEYLPAQTVRGKATYSAATRTLTDPEAKFVSEGVSAGAIVGYWRGAWRVQSVEGEKSLVLARGPRLDITTPIDYAFLKPLGFTLRLVDFRLVHYPPVNYLHVIRTMGRGRATFVAATKVLTDASGLFVTKGVSRGDLVTYGQGRWEVASVTDESNLVLTGGYPADVTSPQEYDIERQLARLRITPGQALDIPSTPWRFVPTGFWPPGERAVVEATMPDGAGLLVPAEPGTDHALDGDTVLRVFRYEPDFKIDLGTRTVTSGSEEPKNPALQVELMRGGTGPGARWLFANPAHQGHDMGSARRDEKIELRYLHPAWPSLVAEIRGPSGSMEVRMECDAPVYTPWDKELVLGYTRDSRIKEYESEVEVRERGRVAKRHVIQVNSPLVHRGIKLSQSDYDKDHLRYTVLGVSRDKGVWFVYAGFVAATIGLMGRFYATPLLRARRKGKSTKEG